MKKEKLKRKINKIKSKNDFMIIHNELSQYISIKDLISNIEYISDSVICSIEIPGNIEEIKRIFIDIVDEYNPIKESRLRIENKFKELYSLIINRK